MADSKRKRILMALAARLAAIRQTSGFHTDAGLYVQHGGFAVSDDDPKPRLALVPGLVTEPQVDLQGGDARAWPLAVHGRLVVDPNDPLDPVGTFAAEDLLEDIKRAIFLPADAQPSTTLPLDGLAIEMQCPAGEQALGREEGGTTAGCVVPLVVVYSEGYGEP